MITARFISRGLTNKTTDAKPELLQRGLPIPASSSSKDSDQTSRLTIQLDDQEACTSV